MVLATSSEKIRDIELPIIDLSLERSEVLKHIVKASEEFGFFKVINHKVPEFIIKRMEDESYSFFSKTSLQKQCAGPANPYGYGCKNIGFNGDNGEVEYLLLHANPLSISQTSKTISSDPITFSSTVDGYVAEVKELACEILELMAQGLRVPHISVFSKFLRDLNSDSLLRLNYYPPLITNNIHQLIIHDLLEDDITDASPISSDEARIFSKEVQTCHHRHQQCKIGFGEHTDPQILTVLRSNDVGGLQISPQDGLWIPVSPHPNTAFSIFVGDTLQVSFNPWPCQDLT
uniref:Gibberellin 2-beta-dioxygenase 2-like isoform X2 n=1 Tax=Nicotiana sylvestris TaxID=4096 RepID=A0A1U7XC04_NICSY|nr:PREDICTED: gibberellin 2-beta-dioxygenase 2-like isoform X2 [Nicotiana sylvestris]